MRLDAFIGMENKAMKTVQDIEATFKASVETQINGDKQHGWGAKDSLAVVEDLLAEFAGEYAVKENAAIRDAVHRAIGKVINPSAFRQKLESKKMLDASKTSPRATFAGF